ncbi:hypothetical protein CUMW_035260 [Citrus unshiu]|nr:hypothetical protein CUMW_035260 [Citrus unshiu]
MKLLDVELSEVRSALALVSEIVCPPFQTALLLMEQRAATEHLGGHLPTRLKGLDAALCGGVPFGVVTELVGPPGTGKTQFCLKLSLLAALPAHYGGLDGGVIYIDVESTFTSRRMIEMGASSFPEIFHSKGMAQEMAGRILVLQPTSLSEFTESLEKIKVSLLQNQVKLLVIDSMAALVPGISLGLMHNHPSLCLKHNQVKGLLKAEKSSNITTSGFSFYHKIHLAYSLLTDDGTEMVVPEDMQFIVKVDPQDSLSVNCRTL